MKVNYIELTNFRNIAFAEFAPSEDLTVIFGDNGQGKTNLLEAIWLLTGAKSFRASKDADLIQRQKPFAKIEADIETGELQRNLQIAIHPPKTPKSGRTAKLSGADQGRASNLAGIFTAVVFEPNHLSLVKGSPEGRRKFVDAALCQLYPNYLSEYRRYLKILTQKNALLKHFYRTPNAAEMLEVFDEQLAQAGEILIQRRKQYLNTLSKLAVENYANISSKRETLLLQYCASAENKETLLQALEKSRKTDIQSGFCTVGPHREDFFIQLNGQPARTDASQGQQRSIVLSLKLAEAKTAEQITGEHPVMLLDDVLSELDEQRQTYLLSRMQGKQIFVSGCDSAMFQRTNGKMFHMEHGVLKPYIV